MAEPVTGSAAIVGAVAKLAGELARHGYNAWKSNRDAKEKLIGILTHVQDELNRNYKSLQDAYNGSIEEWLETAAYDAAIEALSHALQDSPSLMDPLRRAHQLITPGMQARLRRPATGDDDHAELIQLWALVGHASYEIDGWFAHEGAVPTKLSREECAFRRPDELTGGWPKSERLRVLKKWREFRDARRVGKAGEFTLNEIGLSTMYAEPWRELELRERARGVHGWPHSFELIAGIYELWLDSSVRLLYLRTQFDPILLDVVRLTGRDEDGWTPKWYLERSRCRADDWRRLSS
jgi:hypothetical protein